MTATITWAIILVLSVFIIAICILFDKLAEINYRIENKIDILETKLKLLQKEIDR